MTDEVLPDIPVQRYTGPKKPEMLAEVATKSPLSLKVLVRQHIAVYIANETDFDFMKSILTQSSMAITSKSHANTGIQYVLVPRQYTCLC